MQSYFFFSAEHPLGSQLVRLPGQARREEQHWKPSRLPRVHKR